MGSCRTCGGHHATAACPSYGAFGDELASYTPDTSSASHAAGSSGTSVGSLCTYSSYDQARIGYRNFKRLASSAKADGNTNLFRKYTRMWRCAWNEMVRLGSGSAYGSAYEQDFEEMTMYGGNYGRAKSARDMRQRLLAKRIARLKGWRKMALRKGKMKRVAALSNQLERLQKRYMQLIGATGHASRSYGAETLIMSGAGDSLVTGSTGATTIAASGYPRKPPPGSYAYRRIKAGDGDLGAIALQNPYGSRFSVMRQAGIDPVKAYQDYRPGHGPRPNPGYGAIALQNPSRFDLGPRPVAAYRPGGWASPYGNIEEDIIEGVDLGIEELEEAVDSMELDMTGEITPAAEIDHDKFVYMVAAPVIVLAGLSNKSRPTLGLAAAVLGAYIGVKHYNQSKALEDVGYSGARCAPPKRRKGKLRCPPYHSLRLGYGGRWTCCR